MAEKFGFFWFTNKKHSEPAPQGPRIRTEFFWHFISSRWLWNLTFQSFKFANYEPNGRVFLWNPRNLGWFWILVYMDYKIKNTLAATRSPQSVFFGECTLSVPQYILFVSVCFLIFSDFFLIFSIFSDFFWIFCFFLEFSVFFLDFLFFSVFIFFFLIFLCPPNCDYCDYT